MPTIHRRFSVIVPPELEPVLTADAKANHRAVANQIIWITERYYQERKQEADVLSLAQTAVPDRREEPILHTPRKSRQEPAGL